MKFQKNTKDILYRLLQEPTLDNFREFMQGQTGEHNYVEFKQEWIQNDKLAKEMLAFANSGGGVIVFGIKENEDKSYSCDGLSEIVDKSDVSSKIKNYISSSLQYDIFDYSYASSEYQSLENKKFQMMVIEDTPEFLPFISRREGKDIKPDTIYVRRGTSCEIADEGEIRKLITRRINHIYPNNGRPLELKEHLTQLKELFSNIHETKRVTITPPNIPFLSGIRELSSFFSGEYEEIPNPLYPEEGFEEFILRMITEKKKKIEKVLDLH